MLPTANSRLSSTRSRTAWRSGWRCCTCWQDDPPIKLFRIIMPMQRIGLFPGTFDPITIGHQDIINRSLPLFDKLFIGIGTNAGKLQMFSAEQRLAWIREIYKGDPRVDAIVYDGLTI